MNDMIQNAGEASLDKAQDIASYIPYRIRGVIYSLLATAILLELIWNLVPDVIDGKVQATINVLGFGMAALNTRAIP